MSIYSTTHASLLLRLGEGADPAAWREFFDAYGELIRGFARRQGLQAADGEDVLQDLMLALTRAMPGFEYDPARGKFRSYLKTLALHAIYRKRFQNRGRVELEHLEEATRLADRDESVELDWELEWRRHHVRRAMRTIQAEFNVADCRAFERYAVEGQDARAVAAELGLSTDQVYQAKSRILRRLTELIETQVAEEG